MVSFCFLLVSFFAAKRERLLFEQKDKIFLFHVYDRAYFFD